MLNNRQQEALHHTRGACLVLAGAGSGKTSVITQKIAHLVQTGLPAERIFAVTFTNKAAREMRTRVGKIIKNTSGLWVSTFHQFGLMFLRYEIKKSPLKPNFSIMDADDTKKLIKELLLSDGASEDAANRKLIDSLMAKISQFKNDLVLPDDAINSASTPEDKLAGLLYEKYERHLRAYNAVDFDDLIVLPVKILREDSITRDKWQRRVGYLLVDEYQDTNSAQYELIKLLVGKMGNFTVVGDDDQSIYAWRGAKPENIALLNQDYPDLKVVKLEQNYRSTNRILASANAVITHNPHLFEKKLWSDRGDGDKIRIISNDSDIDEAQRVAKEIYARGVGKGCWGDFAILYRSNFLARVVEIELRKLGVPYKISGGTSFFAKSEIKDVMAYLRLIINPDDDPAFLRVVNTPKRGIGSVTLEKLGLFAREAQISLLSACEHGLLTAQVGARAAKTLHDFADTIAHYTRALHQNEDPIPVIREMLADIHFYQELEDGAKTPTQYQVRVDNIEVLFSSINNQIARADDDDKNLDGAIRALMLLDMIEQKRDDDEQNQVHLSTLHAAKGLEYSMVYMIGVEDGILPHQNALASDLVAQDGTQAGLHEERRLMYVGITRAKHTLTISYCKNRMRGKGRDKCKPSRFLDEIPPEHIQDGKSAAQTMGVNANDALANLRKLLDMD